MRQFIYALPQRGVILSTKSLLDSNICEMSSTLATNGANKNEQETSHLSWSYGKNFSKRSRMPETGVIKATDFEVISQILEHETNQKSSPGVPVVPENIQEPRHEDK